MASPDTRRLDVLIYAHDGRGLGHVSRSAAIAMALRRNSPKRRVLMVTGCKQVPSLTGDAPLDWIKLPAYETRIEDGKSIGIAGHSCFSDQALGRLRAETLAHLIELYRPRVVLVDHSPQGKHKELIPSLELGASLDMDWVLGVRGVVGDVGQVKSELAASLFKKYYSGLCWYGDSSILGTMPQARLLRQFGCEPLEMGYVSRLSEVCRFKGLSRTRKDISLAGTISIPWMGEHTAHLIETLVNFLEGLGARFGHWHLYLGGQKRLFGLPDQILDRLKRLSFCHWFPFGDGYVTSLLQSKTAFIFGGYNSLMDVLWARIPALVLLRSMSDREQEIHLDCLAKTGRQALIPLPEYEATPESVETAFKKLVQAPPLLFPAINLEGAVQTARFLDSRIE